MVGPALVSQQGGNIPAQFECTVKERGIQFETSLEALLCSATRFRALRVFELRIRREGKHRQNKRHFSHTSGKMSGVLCVTSYSSLPSTVRFA